ncbi:MAG: glycosyltransferase, partial [bacterium]
IQHATFVVCPYRDATQSGVLMTSFAFGKPVLATRVGAFPEYVTDGHNGLLLDPEPTAFAQGICLALSGDKYKQYSLHVNSRFSTLDDYNNQQAFRSAYALSAH